LQPGGHKRIDKREITGDTKKKRNGRNFRKKKKRGWLNGHRGGVIKRTVPGRGRVKGGIKPLRRVRRGRENIDFGNEGDVKKGKTLRKQKSCAHQGGGRKKNRAGWSRVKRGDGKEKARDSGKQGLTKNNGRTTHTPHKRAIDLASQQKGGVFEASTKDVKKPHSRNSLYPPRPKKKSCNEGLE